MRERVRRADRQHDDSPDGKRRACSIGFDITEEEQIQRGDGLHFTIRRLTLYEVSVVTFPAYEDTGVEARGRSVKAMRRRALEQWKKDMKGRIHHGTQNDSEQA